MKSDTTALFGHCLVLGRFSLQKIVADFMGFKDFDDLTGRRQFRDFVMNDLL